MFCPRFCVLGFVKMIYHLLHIYYNKFFIKNQVIFQTISFSFVMYILYQNFLKKSIKLRKTQFEYLTLHQEYELEYAAAGVYSLNEG